jgi:hypothetical protein
MEPKDSFLRELIKRKENFAQKLALLSSSQETRELRQFLDEQLASTDDLIELYRKQLPCPSDPLHETIRLILTVSYVSNPEIQRQLAEDFNDDHKIPALLDFWSVFNGSKGETFQTVFVRAVEYVELLRRGSEVLAPNSSTSLKSLHEFVGSASEWLADKSQAQFTRKDISVGRGPAELQTTLETRTSILPSEVPPQKPHEASEETKEDQTPEGDSEDIGPDSQPKTYSHSRYGYRGRNRRYNRERYRRRY